MNLLKKAVSMVFRDPAIYRNEPALDGLRPHDDFRLMMMDLALPRESFAAAP